MRQQLPSLNFYSRLSLALVPVLIGLVILNVAIFVYLRAQIPAPVSPSPAPPAATLSPTTTLSAPTSVPTLEPTRVPLVRVPVLSTAGWRWVRLDGVKFMVPPEVICKGTQPANNEPPSDDFACRSFYSDPRQRIAGRISVQDYRGGSRRTQFLGSNSGLVKECHLLFVDSLFGSVPALQIANDGGWCQGGGGAIVAVVGNKLVTFHELNYSSETLEISRYPIEDTMISTLSLDN